MKKRTLFCILTFVISQITFAQNYGWTDISANILTEADLSDVFFVSDNEGWITVSSGAIILHTTDGGVTFEIQETSLETSTGAIYMNNENEGYAGGGSGFVYKTTNGGLNWDFHGTMASSLTDIDFASATQGYACGDGGAVFRITGSVTNLNCGQPTFFSSISSPSVDNVWICGGNDVMYYDGSTFTFQSGPGGTYNDIFFLNQQEGWIVGNNGVIGHTENGGENWYSQINPDNNSLYKAFFLNETKGWVVGAQGTILHTTNGGETWIGEGVGITTNFFRGVHFTSPTNGYVVGNGKTLLKYTQVSGVDDYINKVDFELFPNPFKNSIQINCSDFNTESGTIEVLSIVGKKILEKEINKGTENSDIDLSDLEPGMYLCKITIDNRSSAKKIIKE